ncbi:hypothetical protein [Rufibacter sp. LB8]|uniref:hypothetical protein n=1 Tax=Rufibacter sp. LB8 TaxID=2777781 RepID=UPI00178C6174|nr:hypothetical protein [Rufibacter sp. LB8]
MSSDKKDNTHTKGEHDAVGKGLEDQTQQHDSKKFDPTGQTQNDPVDKGLQEDDSKVQNPNRNLAKGGNNDRDAAQQGYGDGGNRPRSNPSDNQVDRGN